MIDRLFEIYDGRSHFWQWDTRQKIKVLDNRITEIRFSNYGGSKAKRRAVYTDKNGDSICDVPDVVLQQPKNIIITACVSNYDNVKSLDEESSDDKISYTTIGMNKIAVSKQPKPESYFTGDDTDENDALTQLALLSAQIRDIERSKLIKVFDTPEAASEWAIENEVTGMVVLVKYNTKIIANTVGKDYSITPICNADNEMITINFDGGSAFGVYTDPDKEDGD